MANGKALKNMPMIRNISLQYNSPYIDSVAEYLRYSQYGKLIIIDIGGIVANTGTFSINFTNLPFIGTRFVTKLFRDAAGADLAEGIMYSDATTGKFVSFVVPTGVTLYGQAVYLTV